MVKSKKSLTEEAYEKINRIQSDFFGIRIVLKLLFSGYFTLGAFCTLLTTEMAKYKIGRLRPYFLSVCKIDESLCKDDDGYQVMHSRLLSL